MPVVELQIGGQARRVETEDTSPETIDAIVQQLGGAAPPADSNTSSSTTSTTTSTPGVLQSVGEAVTEQVLRPVTDAASSIISGGVPWTERVADAATMAGPLLAPEATAIGIGAHALGRQAGMSKQNATTVGRVVTGGTALAQGVASGVGAVRSIRAGRAATKAAAEAAPGRAAAELESATAASQAGQAQAAGAAREALAGTTPEAAGATVQGSYPAASAAGRTRVQGATYDPVAQGAAARGLGLDVATPEARALAGELENAEGKWGALLSGKEKAVVTDLLTALRGSTQPTPTGVLNAAGQAVTRVTPPRKVLYADLDAAKLALSKVRGASSVRAAVDRALEKVVEGTPLAAKLKYGGQVWKEAVAPAERIAKAVRTAKSPYAAFRRLIGNGQDPASLRHARNLLEPAKWQDVVRGAAEDVFRRAGGDGARAAKAWEKWAPEVRAELDLAGRMGQLFEGLKALAASEKGRLATVAGQGTARVAALKAAAAPDKAGAAAGFARYLGHRAGYAAAGGVLSGGGSYASGRGGLSSALIGLATAGGIQLAGPAAIILAKGATSRGAAGALATAIAAFGEENPAAKPHADAVSRALGGAETAGEIKAPASASPPPSSPPPSSSGPFSREINAVAHVVGLDPKFLHAVVQRESGYKTDALSEAGAVGLMQVLPDTFERLRPQVEQLLGRPADVGYPLDNLVAGAVLYRQHLDATDGDVEQAARLYHGGSDPAAHGPRTQMYGRGVRDTYARLAGTP